MGQMKRMMEDLETIRFEAEDIAIKVGWMERCEDHFEMMILDDNERSHAYARAGWLVKNGQTTTPLVDLKAALDQVERNAGVGCSSCHNRRRRDD